MTNNNQQQQEQLANRILYLGTGIDDEACGKIMAGLIGMNLMATSPIHFIVNSPGGLVLPLYAIYDVMKACSCPIWTFGVGQVMSAAVPILAAGEKGRRHLSARCRVLIHSISAGVAGNLNHLRTYVNEIEELQASFESILCSETAMNKKAVSKLMDGKDHFFSANEAVKLGIADKIVK